MNRIIKSALETLKQSTNDIWLNMPEEVSNLNTRRGTKNYHWPVIICAEENTRAFADTLSQLRKVSRDDKVDVTTLKKITKVQLEANLGILLNWYGLEYSFELIQNTFPALNAIEDIEDYRHYIHSMLLYINRLHWWVDTLIPWDEMSAFYEKKFPKGIEIPKSSLPV